MKIQCGVPAADRLPPAYRRAANIRTDLGRAIGLYGVGDRSEVVLKTLANAYVVYRAIGARVPVPVGVDAALWPRLLAGLVQRYGLRAFEDRPRAA